MSQECTKNPDNWWHVHHPENGRCIWCEEEYENFILKQIEEAEETDPQELRLEWKKKGRQKGNPDDAPEYLQDKRR